VSVGFDPIPQSLERVHSVLMSAWSFCFGFWGWEQEFSHKSFIAARVRGILAIITRIVRFGRVPFS